MADSGRAAGAADSGRAAGDGAPRARLTVWVDGRVQGVGFRWWVRSRALELGLAGSATNLPDGRVHVIAEGARPACALLLSLLGGPMAPGRVTNINAEWGEPGDRGLSSFVSG